MKIGFAKALSIVALFSLVGCSTVPAFAAEAPAVPEQTFGNLSVKQALTAETGTTVQVEDKMVVMKDGTPLAVRIYRPEAEGKYPVLFTRTTYKSGAFIDPHGKGDYADVGMAFAQMGYVVVVQDVRGKFASQGETDYLFRSDKADGEQTLEWIAQQPWSNQKIGMFGASARGMTQNVMQDTKNPNLQAMFVIAAPAQYYDEVVFQGGAFRQELIQSWLASQNIYDMAKKYGPTSLEFLTASATYLKLAGKESLYWYNPLTEFPTLGNQRGSEKTKVPAYYEGFQHAVKDGFFKHYDNSLMFKNSHIPTYQVAGWYDIFREGNLKNFVGLQKKGGEGAFGNQKLLVGPWSHMNIGDSPEFAGDEKDLTAEMKRWFDYWLKGEDNGIMKEAAVSYYTMGSNEWTETDTWPIRTGPKRYYFHSGDTGTAESLNDGSLSLAKPRGEEADSYVYDPNDPTLTIGGQLIFPDINIQGKRDLVGPEDQREAEKSSLTYTGEKLTDDLTITGEVSAVVYASSDRKDTDFVVRLSDVAPDGTSTLITDGILRARFHQGQHKEVFLEDGKVYKFTVKLGNTSHTFKKGHHIRVAVASSNFPRFDRNTNTGNPIGTDRPEDMLIANNTVYHDQAHASYILLPVVKK
ncbi:CocE/NonD family hydrolase [Brevibacillus dissolubilis]|uniref:CocE/NonD family hydrolase n=1 Tax=Brevibacillus dissolubilis TaxID=1844116 RepID=UPI001115DC71|nr:CocE/NonD family hydrolase [Brevibacillus dissolubilis]